MITIGLPMDRVLHKMKSESMTEEDMQRFETAFGGASTDAGDRNDASPDGNGAAAATAAVVAAPSSVDLKAAIKKDPTLSKFAKMLSVGLPLDSVVHKMTQDGISQADQQRFKDAFGAGASGGGASSGGSSGGASESMFKRSQASTSTSHNAH